MKLYLLTVSAIVVVGLYAQFCRHLIQGYQEQSLQVRVGQLDDDAEREKGMSRAELAELHAAEARRHFGQAGRWIGAAVLASLVFAVLIFQL